MGRSNGKPKKAGTAGVRKRKVSLKELRQKVVALQPVRKSGRVRRPAQGTGPEVDATMAALDAEIGILDPGRSVEDEDDTDYLQSIAGRPGQFRVTWESVYGHRAIFGAGYSIDCAEANCVHGQRIIVLDSKLVELNAGSTPHGKPRKPPVCHKVPWAALETEMLNLESKLTIRHGTPHNFTDAFRKSVCWFPSNLGPGHNACNAAGLKTTAQSVSSKETAAAIEIIEQVMRAFKSVGIWK